MADATTKQGTGSGSNEPYCSECGYTLTGLTDSSKCPECGRPLVEVLTRPAFGNAAVRSKRYQSKAQFLGWPVISIAYGPYRNERFGHARGLIALGDVATGGIACGGIARGIVAVGGLSIGLCAVGGCAVGLLSAIGGFAIGAGISVGGFAIGSIAEGGGAVGFIAQGGGAFGIHARGGNVRPSPGSAQVFESLRWLMGPWPPPRNNPFSMLRLMVVPPVISIVMSTIIGFTALARLSRDKGE